MKHTRFSRLYMENLICFKFLRIFYTICKYFPNKRTKNFWKCCESDSNFWYCLSSLILSMFAKLQKNDFNVSGLKLTAKILFYIWTYKGIKPSELLSSRYRIINSLSLSVPYHILSKINLFTKEVKTTVIVMNINYSRIFHPFLRRIRLI